MVATASLERRTIQKVSWRLLPLIVCSYLVAYIDRTNVAFASLTMNKDIGLDAYVYGWGAGIFFIGYFFFEVPSNVMLHKLGARKWIARIMITWGIVSALMALVKGPVSFLSMRFLLGVAEAGFFPGIILYFTYWYPSRYRGRVISALFLAVPISNALASMASGMILTAMGGVLGLRGWQWVFILEALPAILLAFGVLALLTDRPAVAGWLSPEERAWLAGQLEAEERQLAGRGARLSLFQALTDKRVLALCVMYLATVTANYGLSFFLPQIVKGLGNSHLVTGFLSAIPFAVGTVGLLGWGFSSDRMHERKWHMITACLCGAIGLAGAAWVGATPLALVFMSVATMGIYGSRPAFWPMPSTFLTGVGAAGAIALINSVGNLGGYLGPFMVGWGKSVTGRFDAGLYFLAGASLAGAVLTLLVAPPDRPDAPELPVAPPAVPVGGR